MQEAQQIQINNTDDELSLGCLVLLGLEGAAQPTWCIAQM